MQQKPIKVLTSFALAMISVAAVVNLRNLPIMAEVGANAIFFYVLAGIVFLIPCALICAELSSSMPQSGGVYLWVYTAFGEKTGFFAIWSEWFNNVIGYPANLSFIVATIAYIFIPHISQHRLIMFVLIQAIAWGCILFNFLGIKASSRLNIIGATSGSLIPGALIILLGFIWIFSGKPMQIDFSFKHLIPPLHMKNLAFFIGVLSGYAGMQITAFHAHNVKNPHRDFPRAIALAVGLIMCLTIFASLSIAIVVPHNQLSLVSGDIEGFSVFFQVFHLAWALPILALLIAFSGISTLSAWLLGPARGLAVAAQQKLFPKWCAYENKRGMPTNILLLQGFLITGLSSLFLFATSLSTAFWLLVVLTSQFTLIMNILMFSSAIRLRYSQKDALRPFKIPGGNLGIWIICCISIFACFTGIVLGYFPPAELKIASVRQYEIFLLVGDLLYILVPIIIYRAVRRQPV